MALKVLEDVKEDILIKVINISLINGEFINTENPSLL